MATAIAADSEVNPMPRMHRALISVFDKQGIVELARTLTGFGIEILSTGGTARLLSESGLPVVEVSDYTGFPEIMDGRVKTLHPRIHGGLLARRGCDEAVMVAHGIRVIDLVVVNLYPFEQMVADPRCELASAIEHIDIGGPTMLRAAAKNFAEVTVVVDPGDYPLLVRELQDNRGAVGEPTRRALAAKAFAVSARYDAAITSYLSVLGTTDGRTLFPSTLSLSFNKAQEMRYGENPHQRAAFYIEGKARQGSIAAARQLQGKALSYNNVADADAAVECVKAFAKPTCVIVKHANPCGVASAESLVQAYQRAYQTDPTSAFGGIIAFNRALDRETVDAVIGRQFVEVIIAPQVAEDALSALSRKANVRVLACGQWDQEPQVADLDYKRVVGGLLVQERDRGMVSESDLRVVSVRIPNHDEIEDLLFAWKVVKFVKSNAIVYGRQGRTIGIGAGQMSRIESARIAVLKARQAGFDTDGAVMASDAFFPFRDGIDAAAEAGIAAIIQPGGSMRDDEVIAAANEYRMAMVFTGMRHFRH